MSGELKQFVQDRYEDGKADLFAAFIYRLLGMVPEHGQLGFMTPYVWMFISSYEQMRQHIIRQEHISSLIQLEYSGFEGATVPICTFTLEKGHSDRKSAFVRLSDFVGAKQQGPRALGIIDAHNNEQSAHSGMRKYFFEVNQHEFAQIPGSPIVYWLGEQLRKTLINPASDTILFSDGLIKTGDNLQYLRLWWELISTDVNNKSRYRFCAKGGKERNYYGNLNNVVKWDEETRDYYRSDKVARISPKYLWDKEGITWTKISSRGGTFRLLRKEDIAETGGPSLFLKDNVDGNDLLSFIGVITSSLAPYILQGLNPTLNYQTGDVLRFPLPIKKEEALPSLVHSMIGSSKEDWDSFETSWDFQRFALLDPNQGSQAGDLLADAVTHLREYWNRVSEEQRQREIRNNELVADAYGVRDDVPCDVPLERVSLKRNVAFAYPKDTPEARNEKFAQDVVRELISYAVGCMFGRYSLNKPGLILASQGETLDDFHAQIPNPSFEPDVDNVIPVTETDCFEDDIVTRFRRFLSVVFGKENLAANIAYIEQVLGKSIRKYFVNDFYNDHVKMYSNRPIYWQYSSQTNNKGSFKALVYLHRYTPKTTNVVLNYLRDYTGKIADIADGLERSDRTADKKQAAKLRKVVLECKDYEDQTLYPLATRNLEIDLDDGVLVNYLRMGKALRSIPAIEKKRKEVSTWTWPVHPLGKE